MDAVEDDAEMVGRVGAPGMARAGGLVHISAILPVVLADLFRRQRRQRRPRRSNPAQAQLPFWELASPCRSRAA
jgi:hypothetical protein